MASFVLLLALSPVEAANPPPGLMHSTLLNGVRFDAKRQASTLDRITAEPLAFIDGGRDAWWPSCSP